MKQLNIKRKILLSVLIGFFSSIATFGQSAYQISGNVSSEDGMPLPGVNVLVVGTGNGTATDFDGNYIISAANGDVLEFSYIGFATQTINVTGQKSIDIALVQDTESLADVVVVGYGKRKKSHLTGAIAKVGGDDVAALQTPRVDDALAGKLAGVRVQNVTGEPGGAPKITVRAGASITGEGNPLIVVDGFPISGDLSTVNPNDIESIEVLKDASSAAIYGSRGANGVIIVTTKKGKIGKPTFSYNTYVSVTQAYQRDDLYPTVSEYVDFLEANSSFDADGVLTSDLWATGTDRGDSNYDLLFAARLQLYQDIAELGIETDYQDNVFRNGVSINHDFNVRGGTENVKYFASVGYLNTEAAIQESDYERYNVRVNLEADLTKKLKAGISINGSIAERTIFPIQLHDALRTQPFLPTYHTEESIALVQAYDQYITGLGFTGATSDDGTSIYDLEPGDPAHEWQFNDNRSDNVHIGVGLSGDNGAQAKLDGRDESEDILFANANAFLAYEIIEGLTLKTTLGGDFERTVAYENRTFVGDNDGIGDTYQNQDETIDASWQNETTLNYNKEFGVHDLDLLLGATLIREINQSLDVSGEVYAVEDLYTFESLQTVGVTNSESIAARKSAFFRTNYAYDDRYLASFSIRRDGYSGFGENSKWGNFPAASLGWNVHNEKFWEPIANTLSTFKLRVSYGKLGSTEGIGAYEAQSLLDAIQIDLNGTTYTGLTPTNVTNPDLSWQVNEEQNFGVDLGLFNNKIRLGVDYFISTTQDMLLDREISNITGFDSAFVNQGKLESKGYEIELSATPIRTDNFTWNVNANLSSVDTTVLEYNDGEPTDVNPDTRLPIFRTQEGGGISEFWGYRTTGEVVNPYFLQYPSFPIGGESQTTYIEDINGDGIIDENDEVYLGSNVPDFTWGFSSDFKYKDFDLSFVLQGSYGAEVANGDPFYYGSYWRGTENDFFTGTDEATQALADIKQNTDLFIQDASFIAMRNVTFGYTFNKGGIIESSPLSSLRLYLAATNLFYLWADNYTSFNPEVVNFEDDTPLQYGGQRGAPPVARTWTMGLNMNF